MARPILPCTCGSYRAYNVEQFQGTRFHCGDCNRMLEPLGFSCRLHVCDIAGWGVRVAA